MSKHRLLEDYQKGVEDFINFAKHNSGGRSKMRCPCVNCGNLSMYREKVVREHLLCNGISLGYDEWIWHGEASTTKAKVYGSSSQHPYKSTVEVNEVNDTVEVNEANDTIDMVEDAREHFAGNPDKFNEMLHEAEKPLYPGCTKYTKLSALVKLWNLKAIGSWSDKSFSELLQLLGDMLPDNNHIPTSLHLAKSTLKSLGMEYEKIHACPNDCILYRKEYEDASTCPTCKKSRWMLKKDGTVKDKVPAKVLWYFPPIPRFKRMFNSQNTARDLIWHDRQRNKDGYMRHPADSPAWKHVDTKWPEFAAEKRNLRLAISADGINPHGNPNVRYSCWPVLLVTYNLPPWLCMKRKFIMLTLLISGPKQPGNDIDIYLAPLIDDLKILWEVGVQVYDAYQKQLFNLKVVLLWTINDFPAYGCLSGCSVHGYNACPVCAEQTNSSRLQHGKKIVYTGYRRWLPINHPWRKQKNQFDGDAESRGPPESMNGNEIFNIVGRLTQKWGKKVVPPIDETTQTSGKRKKKAKTVRVEPSQDDGTSSKYWKKKSIFFELEYWKFLLLRHNLDVMHIEKNVCESIIGTLLNIPGKTKDGINSRLDLLKMGLRKELAPEIIGDKTYLPPACYTLSRNEKQVVCRTLAMIRVPDGYSSNIVNCVSMQELKLFGLKSHDCHVLMQQLLPVALRSVLPKHARNTITRLCFFFNAICSKVVEVSRLSEIQKEIVITLCMLEKYFPPSFFDVMVHLMIHLVKEIELCGPVRFRWMYPFERYMKVLKGFVRKGNRTEGCIAEAYIAEEAIEFCTDFLSGINSVGIPVAKNTTVEDDGSIFDGKPLPGGKVESISYESWEQAHLYVLQHMEEAEPFFE